MMICAVEDRSNATVGVKLLVLSVSRTSPGMPIDVTVSKEMAPGLEAWAKGLGLDNVHFRTEKSWSSIPRLVALNSTGPAFSVR